VHLAAESRTLAEAGDGLDTLRRNVSRLEVRISDELRPQLAEAAKVACNLRSRADELRASLEAISQARREATEEVGRLTKKQLSEIKQLTRSPPECVRRTIAGSWMVLYGDRFRGKLSIQFDATKDWSKCQRMLADDNFVSRILSFDPACFDDIPAVPLHIASSYLGISSDQCQDKESPKAT